CCDRHDRRGALPRSSTRAHEALATRPSRASTSATLRIVLISMSGSTLMESKLVVGAHRMSDRRPPPPDAPARVGEEGRLTDRYGISATADTLAVFPPKSETTSLTNSWVPDSRSGNSYSRFGRSAHRPT